MLTYLRLTGLKLGLIINFGEQFVKNGIRRVVNGLQFPGVKGCALPRKDILTQRREGAKTLRFFPLCFAPLRLGVFALKAPCSPASRDVRRAVRPPSISAPTKRGARPPAIVPGRTWREEP